MVGFLFEIVLHKTEDGLIIQPLYKPQSFKSNGYRYLMKNCLNISIIYQQ